MAQPCIWTLHFAWNEWNREFLQDGVVSDGALERHNHLISPWEPQSLNQHLGATITQSALGSHNHSFSLDGGTLA